VAGEADGTEVAVPLEDCVASALGSITWQSVAPVQVTKSRRFMESYDAGRWCLRSKCSHAELISTI
jgi:hypothetical protein